MRISSSPRGRSGVPPPTNSELNVHRILPGTGIAARKHQAVQMNPSKLFGRVQAMGLPGLRGERGEAQTSSPGEVR
jgi:hypothetical protein